MVRVSLVAQKIKNLPTMWETWVRLLDWEDPTHSSILAWLKRWVLIFALFFPGVPHSYANLEPSCWSPRAGFILHLISWIDWKSMLWPYVLESPSKFFEMAPQHLGSNVLSFLILSLFAARHRGPELVLSIILLPLGNEWALSFCLFFFF